MPDDSDTRATFVTVGVCADDQKAQHFSMVSLLLYGKLIKVIHCHDDLASLLGPRAKQKQPKVLQLN